MLLLTTMIFQICSVINMELEERNNEAIVASFQAQDVSFEEEELRVGFRTSEIAANATIPFHTEWKPVYEPMPIGQDQVGTIISSVSNTLDPLSFYDALKNEQARSELKTRIGATSSIPPDESDDLWKTDQA